MRISDLSSDVCSSDLDEAVALGLPHPKLGQAIAVVAKAKGGGLLAEAEILEACRRALPLYMVPTLVVQRPQLPRNPNGKIDRPALTRELGGAFLPQEAEGEGGLACTRPCATGRQATAASRSDRKRQ